jgi:hypothetical protein
MAGAPIPGAPFHTHIVEIWRRETSPTSAGKMPISFSMIVLGTQLVMTIADGVPKFDIARGCRLDSTQAFDLSTGQNETVKRCVADEQQALTQLQTQWSQFGTFRNWRNL